MKKETYLKLKKQKRKAKLLAIFTALSLFSSIIKNNKVNAESYNNSDIKEQILQLILEKAITTGTYDKTSNNSSNANYYLKNNTDIAHRGYAPGGVYENSIEAFKLAGETGFWGCEADVRFDKNGNLVCSHNAVKKWENPPLFIDYLKICKDYGMTAIIDLKYEKGPNKFDENLSPSILKIITDLEMLDSCVIQTDNKTDIPYIRDNSKEARIWFLTDVITDSNIKLIKQNHVECVNIQNNESKVNERRIKKLTENGIDVCVWNIISESGKNSVLGMGAKYAMSDNVLGNYQVNNTINTHRKILSTPNVIESEEIFTLRK